jgi:hypothetical protein
VFLVLRQVMPIASGLAGGGSLNSFGAVSRSFDFTGRSIGWGRRRAGNAAIAALKLWRGRRVGYGAAHTDDDARGAAVRPDGNDYGKAGSDVEALGRGWRKMDR